jgi:hypothetical protein
MYSILVVSIINILEVGVFNNITGKKTKYK